MCTAIDQRETRLTYSVLALAFVVFVAMFCSNAFAASEARVALPGCHVPSAVASAHFFGHVEPNRPIRLTFVLPLRDPKGCADLIRRLYDPNDVKYQRFLTSRQFTERYAPSVASVSAVTRFVTGHGLSLQEISSNRTVLVAQGQASSIESAFHVHLDDYVARNGTKFRAPDREPTLPKALTANLLTVAGFDSLPAALPNIRRVLPTIDSLMLRSGASRPEFVSGTGPNGFLAPSDVKTAYSVNGVSAMGTGQTLGLFELDGYTAGDITRYENQFYSSLPRVPLQDVLCNGYGGLPETTDGASEVTLDIDMMIALAPRANKIIVYEADNTAAGLIAAYNRIASDDTASVVSSSWGLSETAANFYGQVNAESQIFQEMAAQGQTMLVASGDSGAYADSWSLSVQDPASQPFVTGVGGTDIRLGSSESYASESAWGDPYDLYGLRPHGQGSGGGVSILQALPSYQLGIASAGSFVSQTARNVPDVSLYGDYDTGAYAVYVTDPSDPSAGGSGSAITGRVPLLRCGRGSSRWLTRAALPLGVLPSAF